MARTLAQKMMKNIKSKKTNFQISEAEINENWFATLTNGTKSVRIYETRLPSGWVLATDGTLDIITTKELFDILTELFISWEDDHWSLDYFQYNEFETKDQEMLTLLLIQSTPSL